MKFCSGTPKGLNQNDNIGKCRFRVNGRCIRLKRVKDPDLEKIKRGYGLKFSKTGKEVNK